MIRRAVFLSYLVLPLLLGACNNKKQQEAAVEQVQEAAPAAAPVADAAPAPRRDIWKAVGPLMAGTYSGNCARLPAEAKAPATITLGADGKASSGDVKPDFGMARVGLVKRARDDEGRYSIFATVTNDDGADGSMFFLETVRGSQALQAHLTSGDMKLACTDVTGVAALTTKPVYPVLLSLLDGKKRTIGCSDLKNVLVRKDTDVQVTGSKITIGAATYDMSNAISETLTLGDRDGKMIFTVELADKRTIMLAWDSAGNLLAVQDALFEQTSHLCVAQIGA